MISHSCHIPHISRDITDSGKIRYGPMAITLLRISKGGVVVWRSGFDSDKWWFPEIFFSLKRYHMAVGYVFGLICSLHIFVIISTCKYTSGRLLSILVRTDQMFIWCPTDQTEYKFLPINMTPSIDDYHRLDQTGPNSTKKHFRKKVCEINFPKNSHFYNVRFKDGLRACVANGCRFEYCLLVATKIEDLVTAQRTKQKKQYLDLLSCKKKCTHVQSNTF